MAKSQWSFKTATELSAALAAKKVSAVELAQDAIGRIERHDGKINAVCVRDFERGLAAARAADAALARGETRPLLGIPMTVKESYNIAGLPTTWGIPGAEGFHAGRRRAVDFPRQGRRRRHSRQDQRAARARRLAELQRDLRHHQQPLRSRPHAGRLLRRIVGGARGRLWPAVARLRHRRLAARAGVSLRRLRAQADFCAGAIARPHAATIAAAAVRPRPQRDRPDGAQRRRPFAAARCDRRARSARGRQGLPARAAAAAPRRAEGFPRAADRYRSCDADRQGRARERSTGSPPISARPASRSNARARCCPISPRRRGSICGC